MNEEEISETLNQVVPHREVPEGMLAGARRRRGRARVLTGAAAVGLVAALAIPLGLSMGGSAQQVATPAPTPFSTSTSPQTDGVLCPPGDTTPGATLGDVTRGYACGPVGVYGTTNESVQIPLSDDLVADIVDEATSEQQPVEGPDTIGEPYFEYPDNVASLVLLGNDGSYLVMVGIPDGYTWYAPGHTEWEPSWELADRIWAEMAQDSNCTVPEYLYPPDVVVEVYNAGAGAASVERVTQHLEEAGFAVTNTGETVSAAPGGSIIMRGANENGAGLWLVSSYLDTSGIGEMSREDDVVELLITSEFNDEADPFLTPMGLRAIDGSMTCTSPATTATLSIPEVEDYGPEVMQVSYEQEALVAAHPDVFQGFDFSADNQTAIILCKGSEEERCNELVATMNLAPDAPMEMKLVKNSLVDIKAQRVAVRLAAEELGVKSQDAVADRFIDGIALEVLPNAFREDGTLAPEGAEEKLEELGMVEVRVVQPDPPETSIAGVPLLIESERVGSTIQDTNEQLAIFDEVNGIWNAHLDIYAGAAISRHRDLVILYVKRDRMDDARRIVESSGVDEAYWQLVPVDMSFAEGEIAITEVVELAQELGLDFSSGGPDAEAGGIVLDLIDPQELTTLAPAGVARLKDAGLVAVRQGHENYGELLTEDFMGEYPTADRDE